MNPVATAEFPLPPVLGGWREGDPPGRRRWWAAPGPLPLEAGGELPGVRLAFETWGTLAPDAGNAVLVLHALTGDSHVTGEAGPGHPTAGWWRGLVGPGLALDTDRWFVVAPNVLGGCQGSTGPSSTRPDGTAGSADSKGLADSMDSAGSTAERAGAAGSGAIGAARSPDGPATTGVPTTASPITASHTPGIPTAPALVTPRPWGAAFPFLTQRDQVAAETGLADALGIDRWALVIGGSMGGMRALEWAVTHPARVDALLLLATTAAAGAEQIAWADAQLSAIRADPDWCGGDYHGTGRAPYTGLGLARRIAHVTYRSEPELALRFGRVPQGAEDPWRGGRYQVESYLDHHARKLIRRFDAGSYVTLTEAMNAHDVGRGRGGTRSALGRVTARTLVAAVDSDRLYPPAQQSELATLIPSADRLRVIESPYGHDGFLIETGQVGELVTELLG
ncbi:homoserine O-acetyltransferase [Streptomyces sp. NPDC048290]|uniref:homoserine O-acetyltransferase family protein n=1 Tax=Streptomyces sp. NPDC048290 TaxID=3155811 RepID=UPI00342E0A1D